MTRICKSGEGGSFSDPAGLTPLEKRMTAPRRQKDGAHLSSVASKIKGCRRVCGAHESYPKALICQSSREAGC